RAGADGVGGELGRTDVERASIDFARVTGRAIARRAAGRSIEGGVDETPTPLPLERAARLDRDRGPRAPAPRPGGVRAFGRPRGPDDPRPVGRRGEGRLGGGRGRDAGARWARPEARGRLVGRRAERRDARRRAPRPTRSAVALAQARAGLHASGVRHLRRAPPGLAHAPGPRRRRLPLRPPATAG